MADYSNQLKAIISERDGLRSETILMVKSIHQAGFAFVTVSIFVVGLYLKENFIQDSASKIVLLFLLTQVLVFLQFVTVALTANHNVHAGYIEAVEHKLNSICQAKVCIWEHEVGRKYLVSPRCSFALSLFAISAFQLLLQGLFIAVALWSGHVIYGVVLIVELCVATALLLNSFAERKRVSDFARKIFSS
ncbi:MAG: hypothetical protein ACYSWO_25280 [Planctomycetota bacterium]|jgi:hypothetical protein